MAGCIGLTPANEMLEFAAWKCPISLTKTVALGMLFSAGLLSTALLISAERARLLKVIFFYTHSDGQHFNQKTSEPILMVLTRHP
jgi:hypothetical protein